MKKLINSVGEIFAAILLVMILGMIARDRADRFLDK